MASAAARAACLFLATTFGVLSASAESVPTPRISPLKVEAVDGPMAVEGEGDIGTDVRDEPVDTSLIPPSSADGSPVDFSALAAFGANAGNGPLPLVPLDQGGDPFADPLDLTNQTAADGPIDLGGGRDATDETRVIGSVTIDARLTDEGEAIPSGVAWRVFAARPGDDGRLRLVGEAEGGSVTLKLKTGDYLVHAAYGRAGFTKKVTVGEAPTTETVILNAGGMRLAALVGNDQSLPPNDVRFDVYASDEAGPGERVLMVENAPPARTISLNAGIYHVVCRYGDANAIVRADIRVEPGKLTEAALYQNAARLTLKLVDQQGGEALANTSWSVVTPAGESVVESVGAFPSVVLAAGDYTAIAKHGDRIFERNFTVEAGLNRDVEVLAQ